MNKSILIVCSLLILIASPTIAFESACKLSDSEMKALEAEITTRVIAELEAQITAKVISQLTNDADSMKAQLSGDCDWKQSLDGTTCYLEGMNVAIYNGNLILEENEGDNDISEDSKNNIVFGSGNKLHSASMSLIGGEDNQVVGVHNTILSSMDNILDADFAAIIGGEANDVRKTGTVINSVGVCVVDAGLDCLTPGQGTGNGGISVQPKKRKGKAIKPVKPTTTPKTKSKSKSKSKAKSKLLEQARTASRTTVISSDSSTASGGGTMISGSNSTVTGDGSTAIGTSNTCVSNGPSCPPPGTPAFLKRSLLGARTSAPTPNVAVGGTGNSIISTDGGNLIAGGVGNSITDCALSSIVGSTTSTISGPSFAKRQDGNAAVAGSTIFGSHSSTIEGSFNHISSSVLAYACEAATLTSQSSTSETCICDSGTCDSLKKKRQTSAVSFDYSQYGAGTYDPYAQRSDPNNIVGSSMSGSYGSDTTEGSSFSITSGAVGHTTYQSNAIQYVPTESFGSAGQVGNQQFEPVPYNGPAGTETCPSGQVLDPQSGHCCPTGEAWSCYYGSPCACCQIGWQFDGESCIPGF